MFISKTWLQDYLDLPKTLSAKELAALLTLHVVEVESVHDQAAGLEHIVVGKVMSVKRHPNADKLNLCEVSDGPSAGTQGKTVQVVCGGTNVREGMLVAFAKVGAKVRWHGEGELVTLERIKIRGEESLGMICSSDEIGLGEMFPKKEAFEILDLTDVIPAKAGIQKTRMDSRLRGNDSVGVSLAKALGLDDVIFDIDNKSLSHRPDLWGHYGVARELGALLKKKLGAYSPPSVPSVKKGKLDTRNSKQGKLVNGNLKLEITVEDSLLCPRYMAVAIDGVNVGPSPAWLQARLRAVGAKPINNIVDITNYVMFDAGQPMHCFDAERLVGPKSEVRSLKSIVVRKAKAGEKLMALDEKECELTDEMLVIADEKRPIAIAGVIGGKESGVTDATKTIIFESANFDAASVRRTAQALGIRTESSSRFEKGLDPTNAELALRRAVQLTLEICPDARVVSDVADESKYHLSQGPIELDLDFLNKKIGMEIKKKDAADILKRLGFVVSQKKDTLSVKIPTWRATKDIAIPEDLIEEIARISGYDKISASLPSASIAPPAQDPPRQLERKIREHLAYEFGCTEVYNYSFVSPAVLERLGEDVKKYIELENPVAKDRPYVRRSLLPSMFVNLEENLHRFASVNLFEIGRVYHREEAGERAAPNSDELLPRQDTYLGMVYAAQGVDVPFYEVSQRVAGVFERLGLTVRFVKAKPKAAFAHPGRFADIFIGDARVGDMGELHPAFAERLGIPYRAAFAHVNLNQLVSSYMTARHAYQELPSYPSVARDIAFIVPREVEHEQVVTALKAVDPLITEVVLFDVYEGKGISEGKKSMAYHLTYRSDEKTLEAAEVDAVHARVEKMLEKEFGAEIRK